jgi:type IV secretory pathway VirD2 relaxase
VPRSAPKALRYGLDPFSIRGAPIRSSALSYTKKSIMTSNKNNEIRPKLGKPKSGGDASSRRLVSQLLARGVKVRRDSSVPRAISRRNVTDFHRGKAAMKLSVRAPGRRSRRVMVKTRIVSLKRAGARSIATHLRYIERDGVTADGSPASAYGAKLDAVDTREFASRCREDRHQFRFIVSPEDGVEIADLKDFTRELMTHMERDLGTKLEWVAVDHWDTDNPHSHVVLRGKDSGKKDLVIYREYITHGMRARATEVADSWLGPRTEQEIQESLNREVEQERWTRIDRAIQEKLVDGVIDLRQRQGGHDALFDRNLKIGRLQHLRSMGLAEESSTSVWTVNPQAEPLLRSMAERGDIIRTMQRAFSKESRDFNIVDPARPGAPIVGRIAAKGLADELNDRRYLIVDGVDGRAHYVVLPGQTDEVELQIGAIVQVRANDRLRPADQTISKLADNGIYRTATHLEVAYSRRTSGLRPEAVVEAHERRLEALRRAGIVERVEAGVWRVPADLAQRGLAYDVRWQGSIDLKILSTFPIDRQVGAIGATWLDQHLLGEGPDAAGHAFGAEVRQALRQRLAFLLEQGLADRQDNQITLKDNLLATLRNRELAAIGKSIAADSGLTYRETIDGESVRGVCRRSLDLASGRFAMLDDGVGFSLVPWRPVMEEHLGRELRGIAVGSNISWDFSRTRGLGR